MTQICPSCGHNARLDISVCPNCGARVSGPAPAPRTESSDRWEKTVIDSDYTPLPAGRGGNAAGDFYKPLGGDAGNRARFTPSQGSDSDRTIIDRVHAVEPSDATIIVRGGKRGFDGPLVYLIERSGIRSGRVHLVRPETSIGRDPGNDVVLGDESVSKHHAKVRLENGAFMFWDLASTNYSFVHTADGQRVRVLEPIPLEDGMTVELGDARLTYLEVDREGGT